MYHNASKVGHSNVCPTFFVVWEKKKGFVHLYNYALFQRGNIEKSVLFSEIE